MSWAIWVTGAPGSGKSTVTREAAAMLRARGEDVAVLELDELRKLWTPESAHGEGEREVVYHALVDLAALLVDAGTPVLIDATGPRRAWRDRARHLIARFAEVQLACPLEVCREREAPGREGQAPGGISDRSGRPAARESAADVPYEPALAPDVVLDTAGLDPAQAAAQVVALARHLGGAVPPRPPSSASGCVLWITGRPGSGKTTLARGVADGLRAAGVEPRVLELRALRRGLLGDRLASEAEEELVHRVLACMAKALADGGRAVIVDATTPRRSWRELARSAIPAFAEVQLVCPPELCAERERGARWRLATATPPGALATAGASPVPEICIEYEESPAAELTLHTHVQGHWSAVQETIRLAWRLLSGARSDAPGRRTT